MAKQDDYIRYTIRVPSALYDAVQKAAGDKSINAEIIEKLEASLSENEAYQRLLAEKKHYKILYEEASKTIRELLDYKQESSQHIEKDRQTIIQFRDESKHYKDREIKHLSEIASFKKNIEKLNYMLNIRDKEVARLDQQIKVNEENLYNLNSLSVLSLKSILMNVENFIRAAEKGEIDKEQLLEIKYMIEESLVKFVWIAPITDDD